MSTVLRYNRERPTCLKLEEEVATPDKEKNEPRVRQEELLQAPREEHEKPQGDTKGVTTEAGDAREVCSLNEGLKEAACALFLTGRLCSSRGLCSSRLCSISLDP